MYRCTQPTSTYQTGFFYIPEPQETFLLGGHGGVQVFLPDRGGLTHLADLLQLELEIVDLALLQVHPVPALGYSQPHYLHFQAIGYYKKA